MPNRKSLCLDLYFRHKAFSSPERVDLKFFLIY